jgi:hypothetical protein
MSSTSTPSASQNSNTPLAFLKRAAVIALLAAGQSGLTAEPAAATIASPYPLSAAGWGPTLPNGTFVSRWANAERPDASHERVTLSAETRMRFDTYDAAQLTKGNDFDQGLFRSSLGAEWRIHQSLRAYGEVGLGSVEGRRDLATANFQNDASVQQLFADYRMAIGPDIVGVMAGRQEFADGPRQLVSVSDGPNLHRTWNGVRLYAHGRRLRLGVFDFRGTRLGRRAFDETINYAERLQGVTASVVISPVGEEPSVFFDPFWFHTENPLFRSGGRTGPDVRDTYGLRVWGKRGRWAFDWTYAQQSGRFANRTVDAWGLFGVQSFTLSSRGWKPRVATRIDVASGGGTYGTGVVKGFNQLYASSGYLGDGLFLSTSNLALVTPGFFVTPTATTTLSLEYGFARRFTANDAAYGGLMRAYAGTQSVPGHSIGRLLRIGTSWAPRKSLTLFANFEYLDAGAVLHRVHLASGSYAQVGFTYRK